MPGLENVTEDNGCADKYYIGVKSDEDREDAY